MGKYAKDLPIDIAVGDVLRVRTYEGLYRNPETRHYTPTPKFEGNTTVLSTIPMPWVVRLGPRWEVVLACFPRTVFYCKLRRCEHRLYDRRASFSNEDELVLLLDRADPLRPYGSSGPTFKEALEMSLDVFALSEGIDDITWEW
jgi:hypothetical protein